MGSAYHSILHLWSPFSAYSGSAKFLSLLCKRETSKKDYTYEHKQKFTDNPGNPCKINFYWNVEMLHNWLFADLPQLIKNYSHGDKHKPH